MEKVEGRCLYEFGDFRVDAVQRLLCLKADGSPLPLVSRAFDTLLYFVQHHGELLDKPSLMKAIWPNAIVEENNLNQSITAIRRVLGESPGEHKFIVTVPGRGYRFVAEVKIVATQPSAGPQTVQADTKLPDISPTLEVGSTWLRDPKSVTGRFKYLIGFLLFAVAGYYAIDRVLLSAPVIDRSIAVLPFENRSEDPTNVYFAEGVQDEITTMLSNIAALKVISRTSTDRYTNINANLPAIAKQLGVAHVLEGSVQKVGDRVRINVQLIDTATAKHLWAETYERKLTDVFAVESEVAKAITATLQAKLTGAEQRELATKPTENAEAYDAYLRGLAFSQRLTRTESEMRYSIEMLEDAVRLDPNFAVAWALLARMHAVLFSNDLDRSASRREAAHEAVEAAVRLRPDLTETLLAQARYLFRIEADYEGAKKILARVREQSPNNAEAKFSLALIAKYEAHWPESFSFFQEAIALDPQNAFYREIFCETYMLARQFAVALKTCDGALDLQPGNEGALITKAIIYQALGELERADAMLAILRPTPGNAPAVSVLSYQAMLRHRYPATIALLQSQLANPAKLDSKVGVTRRWLGDLQRLSGDDASAKANYLQARDELQVVLKGQPNNAELIANIALIYAGLRDKQMAMKYAEQAIALGSKAKRPTRLTSLQQTHARIEARLGEHDQAIAALQYLLTAPGGLPPLTPALLRLDPDWDGLRADPRFQQMVATIE